MGLSPACAGEPLPTIRCIIAYCVRTCKGDAVTRCQTTMRDNFYISRIAKFPELAQIAPFTPLQVRIGYAMMLSVQHGEAPIPQCCGIGMGGREVNRMSKLTQEDKSLIEWAFGIGKQSDAEKDEYVKKSINSLMQQVAKLEKDLYVLNSIVLKQHREDQSHYPGSYTGPKQ